MSERTLAPIFTRGLLRENPLFVLALGACPALAVTTSVLNALGMGLAVIFVLTMSNLLVSLLRGVIPAGVRIPAFIVIIASFVTVVEMVMEAYFFALFQSLGVFIPLIVVNCVILGRAEAFASRNPVLHALIDGLGMGVGFTLALVALGVVREILGGGTLLAGSPLELSLFGEAYKDHAVLVMILPPGAFLTLGLLMAGLYPFMGRRCAPPPSRVSLAGSPTPALASPGRAVNDAGEKADEASPGVNAHSDLDKLRGASR